MDARLKIARMTEGEFSFIEVMHLYNFSGPCLQEEIKKNFPIYVSWKFLIRVPRSAEGRAVPFLFHFFPPFLYSLIHGYFSQSDRSCHSRHIHRFLFPERVMANSARSLESLAMMTPNRVQNA